MLFVILVTGILGGGDPSFTVWYTFNRFQFISMVFFCPAVMPFPSYQWRVHNSPQQKPWRTAQRWPWFGLDTMGFIYPLPRFQAGERTSETQGSTLMLQICFFEGSGHLTLCGSDSLPWSSPKKEPSQRRLGIGPNRYITTENQPWSCLDKIAPGYPDTQCIVNLNTFG